MTQSSETKQPAKKSILGIFKIWSLLILNLIFFLPPTALFAKSMWQLHVPYVSDQIPQTETAFVLTVPKQGTLKDVANVLETQGLIRSREDFLLWMTRLNLDRNMQYGRYQLYSGNSLWQIIQKLCHNALLRITIPEGLTIRQIAEHLAAYGFDKETIHALATDPAFIHTLGLNVESLEGFLFPDTYHIAYGADEDKFITMMVKRYLVVTDSLALEHSVIFKRHGLRHGQIIASLVEKESHYLPERPLIASVFWNRLHAGWRLDSDVTVHYALDDWQKNLTRSDLQVDSPYNTRKYKGLPPTPICNPGRSALEAAFYPEESEYFFFIATSAADGHSVFSKDYNSHKKIKKQLQNGGQLS